MKHHPTPISVTCVSCHRSETKKPSRAKKYKTCSKKCFAQMMKGHIPYHYKGGRLIHKGYVYILSKGHPNGDRDGYVSEHRLVVEAHIGRILNHEEVVHHINKNRSDNRIENLELHESQSDHMKEHFPKGMNFKQRSKHNK